MFDKIIAYSIKHKFIIGLFVLALIGTGIYSGKKLPIDALPDITNNQVQIITTSPSLATQEVELYITYPIELSVKSIPEVVELRSVSRFGLSLVTVVFKEGVDIYWARAQITERLKEAEAEIPSSFGRPQLAPISTGLGEIFQYTVSAAPGYENEYSIMELRSIQDWIIVPQLLGTKGIAEVNTLGGILKEYEVAVNPDILKSMNITMHEIFEALSQNNENTGGAYIDKKPNAYFIRSIGMVSCLEDIQNIVIKTNNDIPVLIKDVAKVKYGSAVRYGATTKDGEGEVVNGMVMMLKGENSAEIIDLVKSEMEKIKTTLPAGVLVEPYLDRSKLVNKAISTIRKNLIEGALIVIFILVLLIGNWRAGLIVATVIPLSLLFAVSLMRVFGVSGNLMSLGAIDFGLIVDGAVIIVEAIVHRLHNRPQKEHLSQVEMDREVYAAASKIRSSAAFGEIIILIVYLPILALIGIEGKMFQPMALTVSFAILGAFLLSLTYVPMMSALILNKKTGGHKVNISDRIMQFFQRLYSPMLYWSMKYKNLVLSISFLLFVTAFFTYKSLGGEFIPTLFEGDLATHVIIPPGSSLEQEIATTTKAEKLLIDNFPEIEQIVSKIGSAEVPTDPMPMEVADMMIILKDKSEWTSASSKKEMFEKMENVLDDLPGVTTEFSQPIQMRFNELMTGIRSDVGVKIFGDDIDRLVALGDQALEVINDIEGVEDARAERVSGLPQITVKYNKDKVALYGLTIGKMNETLRMGFAGQAAGAVYEGERKFDLVVRLAEPFRQDIKNIQDLYITLPSGNQIPLDQVADIQIERGPAQISREEGKRRIIVGFNVRNRDVESVVNEIHSKLDEQLDLPSGYYISYAGQFENLKRANERLAVAVPIALALILILLYFTFESIKQTFLIFTAIPLSAIGGVFALWARDMPFSISAGVGFIALFGVAVLNGIVLISYFNQLKEEGVDNVMERIINGTKVRLRPVIMTAAVASFGFLPMALSTSAGAEVQKPLATVVIGGLITATLLTLIVLPILYYYSENGLKMKVNKTTHSIIAVLMLIASTSLCAQVENKITLDQAIDSAVEANLSIQISRLDLVKAKELRRSTVLPKTQLSVSYGQINSYETDQSYAISQSFNPFTLKKNTNLRKEEVRENELQSRLSEKEIVAEVKEVWNVLNFLHAHYQLVEVQSQYWHNFYEKAKIRYQVGEANQLEKTTAESGYLEILQQLEFIQAQIAMYHQHLSYLLQTSSEVEFLMDKYAPWHFDIPSNGSSLTRQLADQGISIARAERDQLKAEKMPDLSIGYFTQSMKGEQLVDGQVELFNNSPQFHGATVGLNFPIFGKGYNAHIKAAQIEIQIAEAQSEETQRHLESKKSGLNVMLSQHESRLDYYDNIAIPNGNRIEAFARKSYAQGNIGYLELIQALKNKYIIQLQHIEAIQEYNHTLISLWLISQQ
jgi:cobalt-zinc-cadmium resistance protein CzcA